jgi:hypothetical protein
VGVSRMAPAFWILGRWASWTLEMIKEERRPHPQADVSRGDSWPTCVLSCSIRVWGPNILLLQPCRQVLVGYTRYILFHMTKQTYLYSRRIVNNVYCSLIRYSETLPTLKRSGIVNFELAEN